MLVPPTAQNPQLFRAEGNDWVLANINVTGYYQVNYDEDNWRRLQAQLQSDPSVGGPCPRTQR